MRTHTFFSVLVAACASISLSAAAPPTQEQLLEVQAAALANATTSSDLAGGTDRAAPRPKRDHLPASSDGKKFEKRRKSDKRHSHHGHEKRAGAGIGKGAHDRRASGFLAKRDDGSSGEDSTAEVEPRAGTQYPLPADYTATTTSNSWGGSSSNYASKTAASSAASSTATVLVNPGSLGSYWKGASSYYLHAIADADRHAILDALKAGGFKVVRIFIASIGANNKGSNNIAVNDVEPQQVGQYDDTILNLVDQLMVDCYQRGLKLLIALDDRYALGFWSTNAYALSLDIVKAGSSGPQQISNAAKFYTSSSATTSFDARLTHILNHRNSLLGNKKWSELDEVVYAFEPQNEPQGHMDMASSSWACGRAAVLQNLIQASNSSILVSSGGGITLTASLGSWATACDSIDVVSVHDYGTTPSTPVSAITYAQQSLKAGKTIIFGEWGAAGQNKAAIEASFVQALQQAGIPWMVWEVTKPGKGAADFEVWTDEPAWAALTGGNVATYTTTSQPWTSSSTWASKSAGGSSSSAWTSSSKAAWTSSSSAWSKAAATTTTWSQQQQQKSTGSPYKKQPGSSTAPAAKTTTTSWK